MKTLGSLADEMHALREEKRDLEAKIKLIEEKYKSVESELIALADAQDTTVGKGSAAAFSVTERVVPQVKDWDAFHKFIKRHNYFHLLERRPSVTGCRELFDTKGTIPGVDKFTIRSINLRSN